MVDKVGALRKLDKMRGVIESLPECARISEPFNSILLFNSKSEFTEIAKSLSAAVTIGKPHQSGPDAWNSPMMQRMEFQADGVTVCGYARSGDIEVVGVSDE